MVQKSKVETKVNIDADSVNPDEISVPYPAIGIRSNCKDGAFKFGEAFVIGESLDVVLVCPPIPYYGFFKKFPESNKPPENLFYQVWFVPIGHKKLPQNRVFVTYIKGISLNSLNEYIEVFINNKPINTVVTKMQFEPKTNNYGSFYYCSFSLSEVEIPEKVQEELSKFIDKSPVYLDSKIPVTMKSLLGIPKEFHASLTSCRIEKFEELFEQINQKKLEANRK